MNTPLFEVYESKDGNYRWRLKSGNGEIVAISEGYTTRYSAHRSAERVKMLAAVADIVDL